MTALKWLLIVVSAGYACGLAVLFFAQRSFLFPVPTTERTAPQAAGAGVEVGGGMPVAPLGTQAYNPAFDVTPPELVTALVTEYGALSPVTRDGIVELCAQARQEGRG